MVSPKFDQLNNGEEIYEDLSMVEILTDEEPFLGFVSEITLPSLTCSFLPGL